MKVAELLNLLTDLINSDERGYSRMGTFSGTELSMYKLVITKTTEEERQLEFEKKNDL